MEGTGQVRGTHELSSREGHVRTPKETNKARHSRPVERGGMNKSGHQNKQRMRGTYTLRSAESQDTGRDWAGEAHSRSVERRGTGKSGH